MPQYPFLHDLKVHIVADDRFEVALYARDKKKYRRWREIGTQTWQDTVEEEISSDLFYFLVACVQRRKRGASGLV